MTVVKKQQPQPVKKKLAKGFEKAIIEMEFQLEAMGSQGVVNKSLEQVKNALTPREIITKILSLYSVSMRN